MSESERDEQLGAALSGIPTPDHGPTFWADLNHRLQGDMTVHQLESAKDAGPADESPTPEPAAVSLDERRDRRAARRSGSRFTRSLGAAAAAVALVVAAAGALTVFDEDGIDKDSRVQVGDRPPGTAQPGPTGPTAPAEFSATYEGIDHPVGVRCPVGTCLPWNLTLAVDGSFRWTRSDGSVDKAYDAASGVGRQVEEVARGAGASKERPNAFETTGVPAGGPDMRIFKPEPLGPIADFVVALARAGDPRVATATSQPTGRPVWRYDGPTVQDRLGGNDAPNHAVAEVDQASGVLLQLVRSVRGRAIEHFVATKVSTANETDRSKYQLAPPPGADTQSVSIGFAPRSLDEVAAALPYPLLVPGEAPAGFELHAVALNQDEPSPTGPEGMNPPVTHVVAMTWRSGGHEFTVTLRPTDGQPEWNDPLGAEGMLPDKRPVTLVLPDRPALEGEVVVDAPLRPHLWGITGDIVITVSGDLPSAELERVAASLRPHQG